MSDPIPDLSNPTARWVSRIFHPYLLPIPTLIILLSDLPLPEMLEWIALVVGIVLVPAMLFAAYLQRRGRFLYERQTRGPLYLVGWFSVLICLGVVIALEAPRILVACVAALAIWAPLQGLINARFTKVSGHAAVAAGCFLGLLLAGKLTTLPLVIGVLALVAITVWARVVTRNHTIVQVILGIAVGALPVVIIFPLFR